MPQNYSKHLLGAASGIALIGALSFSLTPARAQTCAAAGGADCHSIPDDFTISGGTPDFFLTDTDMGQSEWKFLINDSSAVGPSFFELVETGSETPFRIDGGARGNALRIDATGLIGIGTATPAQELHIMDTGALFGPAIHFQDNDGQDWELEADDVSFTAFDVTNGNRPLQIEVGAPNASLFLQNDGDVGMGTFDPAQALHIVRAAGGAVGNNVGFRLQNSTTGSQWEFTAVEGATDHFIINKLGSGKQEMRLNEAGDMSIVGKIITGGPSCMAGCDAVFSPGFEIESVEEHAAAMWGKSHLPAVGPTSGNGPINLSEKIGGLVNELEKAHIYIERLHQKDKQQKAALEEKDRQWQAAAHENDRRLAEMEKQMARFETLLAERPAADH